MMKFKVLYTKNILIVTLCACVLPAVLSLNLDGSPGSYVKYPPWEPCSNGSFSFEFKTREQNALLLYLNKGEYLFFEIKMFKGGIRLRVNVGEGTLIIRSGENLDNNEWHSVEVRQDGDMTYLSVDGREQQKKSPGLLQYYVHSSSNDTFLFIGGLPVEYESKLFKSLALPSVVFEPRFRGSIRNLFYRTCGGESLRQQPLESKGLLTSEVDLCEKGNPCLNGGKCLTTDDGILCNCVNTEYKGDRCDIQKVPSDATFLGTQYFSYNLSSKGDGMVSNQDQIMLDFRTKQPSSLLFYTGNAKDYITAGLIDGSIFLAVNLGLGPFEASIRETRFDDNRWHQLVIRRDAKEISMELDGMYKKSGSTTGKFVKLSSNVLYVAGSPNTGTLAGSKVKTNFKGCLRKVRYQADSIRIDLTELARNEHGLLEVIGEVIFDKCQELVESQPVTFTTADAFLTVPTWERSSMRGTLAFQFHTVEPGGLLMYSNGDRDSKDFFALELLDSHLYLIWDMGSGIQKIQVTKTPVSDGKPHDIYFEFSEHKGYISVDGIKEQFESKKISDRFDLHGLLYVGGLGSEVNVSSLPRELWAVMLGMTYIGCLQDLVVNGNRVDLLAAAKLQNKTSVMGYCRKMEPQCSSHPCSHQGKCIEGWNRFTCDCRATGYVGSVCQTAAPTLRFDGTQYLKVTLATESITQAEDISVRFRSMHPSGLLFLTTGQNDASMELYLESGTLFLSIRVDGGVKTLSAGHSLNDDRWHTVFIKRRVHTVELTIDQDRPVTDKIPGSTFSLVTSRIYVGHVVAQALPNADLPGQAKDIGLRSVETGSPVQQDEASSGKHSGFIGSMQSFLFNNKDLFQMAQSGSKDNIEISARFSSDEQVVREPVTFKSEDAFAVLPRLQLHDKYSMSFQFKTTESDGLIFYNDGSGQDFFAMEMFQGYLYYVYNMGEGPQKIKANVNQPLNDNKWHEVRLLRMDTNKQLLRVDDNTPTIDDLTNAKNNKFDLTGLLHVGGVHKVKYPSLPKLISSQHGFVGCLGSLNLNGYTPNLLQLASYIHEGVGDGCRGPVTKCVNDSCANQGRCVQQWTSYRCDCDMTSYTGPMCKDESVSYKFGPGPGLITFTYPEGQQPSTNFETLAFGFQTFQDTAVLIRVDSQNYGDFIQLELEKGNVILFYNMGTLDHPLGNFYQKVNDGRYHVVRFTRNGPNATLQIDSEIPQWKHPTGQQSHTFNNQAYIRIGGKKETNGSISEHFEGIISGLVLNGVHIFELAKQHDPKIKLEGSVTLNVPPKTSKNLDIEDEMQSTQGISSHSKAGPLDSVTEVNRSIFQSKEPSDHLPEASRFKREAVQPFDWTEWTFIQVNKNKPTDQVVGVGALDEINQVWSADPKVDPSSILNHVKKHKKNTAHHEVEIDSQSKCVYSTGPFKLKEQLQKKIMSQTLTKVKKVNSVFHASAGQEKEAENSEPDDVLNREELDHTTNDDAKDEGSGHEVVTLRFENLTKRTSHYRMDFFHNEQLSTTLTYPGLTHHVLHDMTTAGGIRKMEWDINKWQTTAKEGVTDDIISTGPGSGCQFDDEDDCSGISSGNEEEIITAVVIIKSTTSPSTTTTKQPAPCEGPQCETHLKHTDSTLYPPHIVDKTHLIGDINGQGNVHSDQSTAEPGKGAGGEKDSDSGINLGLILGITGSVLVAVIVLCIALCKLRSRDEGTYKVDETQNFSALLSKKSQGNGAVASGSESGAGKRGKKKDVKECCMTSVSDNL